MATANLGRVGFVNKGTYSGATAYKVNDVVTYNTGTYACIQANTGQAPTNTSYWQNWVSDNAVHKTGDETIAGVKTFSDAIIGAGNWRTSGFASFGYGTSDGVYLENYGSATTGIKLGSSSGGSAAATIQYRRSNGTLNFMNGDALSQIDRLTIDALGNVLVTGSGGLGYGTGSGGTVTQLTNKGTNVTLNKPSGQIIMNNAALAANTVISFFVANNLVSSEDTILLSYCNIGVIDYRFYNAWSAPQSGGFYVLLKNIDTSTRSEAVKLNYTVIKGATA